MRKTILAAALILGAAMPAAASDQPNKPSGHTTIASQEGQIGTKTPFNVFVDGNWIFVVNAGMFDWKGALDVTATCTPLPPTTSCGSSFAGGTFKKHYAAGEFPKGHGYTPCCAPTSNNNVVTEPDHGYVAIGMSLPNGKYKITARAANNYSPEKSVTIQGQSTGSTIQLNPGAIQLSPTKTPTPSPRRP